MTPPPDPRRLHAVTARFAEFGPRLDYRMLYDAAGDPNDAQTRHEIRENLKQLLLCLKVQRYVYDLDVFCDERNNTREDIDLNMLWVDLVVQTRKGATKRIHLGYHYGKSDVVIQLERFLFRISLRPYHF